MANTNLTEYDHPELYNLENADFDRTPLTAESMMMIFACRRQT